MLNAGVEEKATEAQMKLVLDAEESILNKVGSTAFINIKGLLSNTPPSFFDVLFGIEITTYKQIIDAVAEVLDDAEIKTVQLNINSPGGEVFGTDEAAQAVAKLSAEKEVRVINEGLIASAAFWIAAQGGEILSTSPTNMTGSVGVVITAIEPDFDEKAPGIKRARIVSRNAPNKRPNIESAEGKQVLQDEADALERIFIQRVSEGRGVSVETVISDFGQGGVLVASDPDPQKPDAIKNKMIDGVININRQMNEVTGTVELAASQEIKTEEANMADQTPLTVQEIRANYPDAVKEIEQSAENAERDRISSIEKLMESLTALPESVQKKARAAIDAKKFDGNCTANTMSLELLGVTSAAQADFIKEQAQGGRDAAKIAENIPSGKSSDTEELTEEEAVAKEREDGLMEGAKKLAQKKEARNA
jgi:ClpP class serine protease